MPYATYKIQNNMFKDIENLDFENLDDFLKNIKNLNKKKRAILVDDEDNNIINILNDKINNLEKEGKWKEFTYDKRFSDKKTLLLKEKLNDCLRIFKESIKCFVEKKLYENLVIDFIKDEKNKFDEKIYDKYNEDIIYPENFNLEANKFKKKFLEKIKVLILSTISAEKRTKGFKKRINGIGIIHKELSNYLLPDMRSMPWDKKKKEDILKNFLNQSIEENMKDPKCGYIEKNKKSFFVENVKKTEGGNKLLLNWWNELSEDIKPRQFKIITDIPIVIPRYKKDYLKLSQVRFEDFLFNEIKGSKFKPQIEFIDRYKLGVEWNWSHKKHFIFGKDVSLLIYSDYGGEFVQPNISWNDDIGHWNYNSYKEDEKHLKLKSGNKFYFIKENTFDFKQIKELIAEKKWF